MRALIMITVCRSGTVIRASALLLREKTHVEFLYMYTCNVLVEWFRGV